MFRMENQTQPGPSSTKKRQIGSAQITSPQKRNRQVKARRASSSSPERSRTPEDAEKCAICIGEIGQDRALTNTCQHPFCYPCIHEWAKVKHECPVCRNPFHSIITGEDPAFVKHMLPSITNPLIGYQMSPFSFAQATSSMSVHPSIVYNASLRQSTRSLEPSRTASRMLSRWPELSLSSYFRSWQALPLPVRPDGTNIRQEFPLINTIEHRRYIYTNGLYVLPFGNGDGNRYREVSAHGFKQNRAWVQRLQPFIALDLGALVENVYDRQLLFSIISKVITRFEILSVQFRRILEPYVLGYTDHFLHELYNFARSAVTMQEYQENAVYVRQSATIVSRVRENEEPVVLSSDEDGESLTSDFSRSHHNQASNSQNSSDNPQEGPSGLNLFHRANPSGVRYVRTGPVIIPPRSSEREPNLFSMSFQSESHSLSGGISTALEVPLQSTQSINEANNDDDSDSSCSSVEIVYEGRGGATPPLIVLTDDETVSLPPLNPELLPNCINPVLAHSDDDESEDNQQGSLQVSHHIVRTRREPVRRDSSSPEMTEDEEEISRRSPAGFHLEVHIKTSNSSIHSEDKDSDVDIEREDSASPVSLISSISSISSVSSVSSISSDSNTSQTSTFDDTVPSPSERNPDETQGTPAKVQQMVVQMARTRIPSLIVKREEREDHQYGI